MLKIPQRVYCFECVSKSGPNIKPPISIATVTTAATAKFSVSFQVTANVGATSRNVMASCVLPEGISILDFRFWILDFGFWILDFGLACLLVEMKPALDLHHTAFCNFKNS